MKIGNVEIENSLALGPMAGVTDLPFRLLCKELGCGMLYTEMVSAKAILYKNKNTNIAAKKLGLFSIFLSIFQPSTFYDNIIIQYDSTIWCFIYCFIIKIIDKFQNLFSKNKT